MNEVGRCQQRVSAIGREIEPYCSFEGTPEKLLREFSEACKDLDKALLAAGQGGLPPAGRPDEQQ